MSEATKRNGKQEEEAVMRYEIPVVVVEDLHKWLREKEGDPTGLRVGVLIPALTEGGDVDDKDILGDGEPQFCPTCGKRWKD